MKVDKKVEMLEFVRRDLIEELKVLYTERQLGRIYEYSLGGTGLWIVPDGDSYRIEVCRSTFNGYCTFGRHEELQPAVEQLLKIIKDDEAQGFYVQKVHKVPNYDFLITNIL